MHSYGYATWTDLGTDRPVRELDTLTCGHCSAVVFVQPGSNGTIYLIPQPDGTLRAESGAACMGCADRGRPTPVCLACHEIGTCLPIEKWLELMERRATTP